MPAIKKPNQHFDVLTWSGTGGSSGATRSITGLNFQPDFIWEKSRTSGSNHQLLDSVRGVGQNKSIATNSTGAEPTAAGTESLYGWLSSIDSGGFTLTNGTSTFDNWNKSGDNYIGWTWKAGGTAVTNSSGSLTSQVSANPTAGFSVVTYTSPNNSSDATVGHGLSAAPQFIITKNRDSSFNWDVWHQNLSSGYDLTFEALAQQSGRWSTTTPTSSVFTVKYNYEHYSTNRYIAYCWTSIAGYSQFGSYTGNGSTDGAFVYLGFRPRFLMIKNITNAQPWMMIDTARNTYNVGGDYLQSNSSGIENALSTVSSSVALDILSNGFKLRNAATSSGYTNASGDNYVYAAFAEAPFKYSSAR